MKVIAEYVEGATSGDMKMAAALEHVIMPRFRVILNAVMKDMHIPREERIALKLMLEEVLDSEGKCLTSG